MTPELRQVMIKFSRKMAYPLPGCTEHGWERGLFMYRDEATVRKFVSKWFDEGERRNYGAYLGDSGDPEVIRLMGPYLFDATGIPNSRDVGDGPIPKNGWVATRLGQYQAIASCVEFPEDVRIWSRRLASTAPPGETELAILQRWWKENEAAFQAREYGKVKPGVLSIPGMKRSVMANPPNFETSDAEPSSPPTATTPANKPRPVAAARIASGTQLSAPSSALLWSGAVAAVALITGLLFLWKRRA